jgi:hypothetical protein
MPEVGHIFPYSEQYVSFIFNGLENSRVSIQAVCEVARGSPQILYVHAIADTIRCDVPQYDVLDFGLQVKIKYNSLTICYFKLSLIIYNFITTT